jgi:hypothetical protein
MKEARYTLRIDFKVMFNGFNQVVPNPIIERFIRLKDVMIHADAFDETTDKLTITDNVSGKIIYSKY